MADKRNVSRFIRSPVFIWMCVISVISILPMFSLFTTPNLPHMSDGAMHLARIASFYKEIIRGQFPVRWAGDLNYGYGTPIFNFFHPLPYLITTPLVGLGVSLTLSLKISFLISYILSGIGMYLFAYAIWKRIPTAVTIALLYQFAPFRLVEINVRGSLGGIYSYSLLPFVLLGVVRFLEKKQYPYIWIIAFCSAGLAMSHNIIGFVFFGVSFLFTLWYPSAIRIKLLAICSLFAGVGIAGFFVIPAILDHSYTYGYLLTKNLFYDHFAPLTKFILPNILNSESLRVREVSVQIGIVNIFSLCASLFLLFKKKLTKKEVAIVLFCNILFIITLYFMLSISKPLWENISVLRQFQYPWRLLAIIVFLTSLSGFSILRLTHNKTAITALIFIAIVSTIYYWKPPMGYQSIQEADYWNYPLTTNYYGEVDTIWTEGPAKSYPEKSAVTIAGTAAIEEKKHTSIEHVYSITAEGKATIRDNTEYFPGWIVVINGINAPIQFQDPNNRGIITFDVPDGTSNVIVKWKETKMRLVADWISVLSILLVIALPILMKKHIALI